MDLFEKFQDLERILDEGFTQNEVVSQPLFLPGEEVSEISDYSTDYGDPSPVFDDAKRQRLQELFPDYEQSKRLSFTKMFGPRARFRIKPKFRSLSPLKQLNFEGELKIEKIHLETPKDYESSDSSEEEVFLY